MLKFYELQEVAEMLKINLRVLRQYVREGKIKASKIGRKYLITDEALKEFIKENEIKAK